MPPTFIRTTIQKTTQETTRAAGSDAPAICDATNAARGEPTIPDICSTTRFKGVSAR